MQMLHTPWRYRASDHPQIEAIAAFNDNYIWLIHDPISQRAVVVDPGDARPVIEVLSRRGLRLSSILITHHHRDHTGGVAQLLEAYPGSVTVFGPANESIAQVNQSVSEGQSVAIWPDGPLAEAIEIPGHTRGHIAFFLKSIGDDTRPVLFCGDTLFAAGCGRIFEGTPAQMLASLDRLASLPTETLVYCAHEYTVSNLRFARAADPGNADVVARVEEADRLRADDRATLPSTIGIERATNPFLRVDQAGVRTGADMQHRHPAPDRLTRFAALREWKNNFR